MIARSNSALESLEAAVAADAVGDFSGFVAGRRLSDPELAELIEVDARSLLERGRTVTLERYLSCPVRLESLPISLDAAIEFSLRSFCGSSRPSDEAVERLVGQHPALEGSIRNTAALSLHLATTRTLRVFTRVRPARGLPSPFGPRLNDGRLRYELRRRLGGGSQGEVYLAADLGMSEPDRPALVAIKITAPTSLSPAERWRAIDEATRARRVAHEHVVRVLDRGTSADLEDYVVFEHVDGGDLEASLRAGPLSAREAASLVARIARGVQAAHSAGLVHRDLKPSNVLLTRDGVPKVADFGCAANLTASNDNREPGEGGPGDGRIGNLAFIAPEQYRVGPGAQSAGVDVYALGGILYYLLTGLLPHGSSQRSVHQALAADVGLAPLRLPGRAKGRDRDLALIVARATTPRPEDRCPTADALATDLESWLGFHPLTWTRPSPWRRARLLVRRSPRSVLIGVVAAAMVLGAGALSLRVWTHARERVFDAEVQRVSAQAYAESETRAKRDLASSFGKLQSTLVQNPELEPTDWMPVVTILESLSGPRLFGREGVDEHLWNDRIGAAGRLIAQAEADGQGNSVEALQWRDLLGYWLLRSERTDEAIRSLTSADAGWESKLAPNDPWRTTHAALKAIGTIQRCSSRAASGGSNEGDPGLVAAGETLASAAAYLDRTQHGDFLHRFVIDALGKAYLPGMLDQPSEAAWARGERSKLESEAARERPSTVRARKGLPSKQLWDHAP